MYPISLANLVVEAGTSHSHQILLVPKRNWCDFENAIFQSCLVIAIFRSSYDNALKLTHWGRVTHICVGNLTIIGSDNGLSPGRRQAIIWTNAGILLIRTLGTNFSEILGEIHSFSYSKIHLKMSSAKWRPFCLGLNELMPQDLTDDKSTLVQIMAWWRHTMLSQFYVAIVTSLGHH